MRVGAYAAYPIIKHLESVEDMAELLRRIDSNGIDAEIGQRRVGILEKLTHVHRSHGQRLLAQRGTKSLTRTKFACPWRQPFLAPLVKKNPVAVVGLELDLCLFGQLHVVEQ